MQTRQAAPQSWGNPEREPRPLTPDRFIWAYMDLWFRQVAVFQDWYATMLWETTVTASLSRPRRHPDREPPVLAMDRFLRSIR